MFFRNEVETVLDVVVKAMPHPLSETHALVLVLFDVLEGVGAHRLWHDRFWHDVQCRIRRFTTPAHLFAAGQMRDVEIFDIRDMHLDRCCCLRSETSLKEVLYSVSLDLLGRLRCIEQTGGCCWSVQSLCRKQDKSFRSSLWAARNFASSLRSAMRSKTMVLNGG